MKGGTPDGSSFPAFLHLRTIALSAMKAFPNHCPQFGSWQEGAPLFLFEKSHSFPLRVGAIFTPPPQLVAYLESVTSELS